jgi:hypothetical protein
MGKIWTRYAESYMRGVTHNPAAVAFSAVGFAFVAGSESKHLWAKDAGARPYFMVFLFLLYAVLMAYFLVETIRQLRDSR